MIFCRIPLNAIYQMTVGDSSFQLSPKVSQLLGLYLSVQAPSLFLNETVKVIVFKTGDTIKNRS